MALNRWNRMPWVRDTVAAVFLSHRSADKPLVRELAQVLLALGVDVYFDELDSDLQRYAALNDPQGVVHQIDTGLQRCSHLLGVISERTRGSWWVPYEIGSARNLDKKVGYVILDEVDWLPEYMQVSDVLKDRDALLRWVADAQGVRSATLPRSALRGLPSSVPSVRTAPIPWRP